MGASSNATLLTNLLDPQVVADFIDKKLVDAIRLAPLAKIDTTLVGRPGDTVTLPSYSYVGDATQVTEGNDIPIAQLTQTSDTVTVIKIGRAVEYSDEALLSGYNNDIAEQAAQQLIMAVNSGVEKSLINAMSTTATKTATVTLAGDPVDDIADALTQFGEDIDGDKVIVVPNNLYAALRKSKDWIPNTEIGADMIVKGVVGMVHGCQIITSNRMTTGSGAQAVNNAYIIKPNALAIYMKRNTLVEFDRDIISEMNYIKASKIFAPYVYDKSKLIKLTIA